VTRKGYWAWCGVALASMAFAQDGPASLKIDQEAPPPISAPPTEAEPHLTFDPFFDMRKTGQGYETGPALETLYSLHLPDRLAATGPDEDLNAYLRDGDSLTASLKARVDAMTRTRQVSVEGLSCGLGLSFADCAIPSTPCTFKLGIFDPKSQAGAVPTAREDYSFSLLSNRCSF
jgi:hypothetical protein